MAWPEFYAGRSFTSLRQNPVEVRRKLGGVEFAGRLLASGAEFAPRGVKKLRLKPGEVEVGYIAVLNARVIKRCEVVGCASCGHFV